MYEGYDAVLQEYGQWIMSHPRVRDGRRRPYAVVRLCRRARQTDEQFTLSPDGVHPNSTGHRLLGEAVLKAWGIESSAEPDPARWKLIKQRTALLHDAWLTETGHQRPGVTPGLPLAEATAKADELSAKIDVLVEHANIRSLRSGTRQEERFTKSTIRRPRGRASCGCRSTTIFGYRGRVPR